METLTLPGRKTDRFLRIGVSKKLGGFGSDSRDKISVKNEHFKQIYSKYANTVLNLQIVFSILPY